jgi:ADP-ribose pyrophosphatase
MIPELIAGDERYRHRRAVVVEERWATADGEVLRPVVRFPTSVGIIACPAPGRILMVRQWRYPVRRVTVEIPAGTVEPGEDPLAAAVRELREETGWGATAVHEVLRYTPEHGTSDETVILVEAIGLHHAPLPPDPGEHCEVLDLPLAEARALAIAGGPDARTLLALARLGAA